MNYIEEIASKKAAKSASIKKIVFPEGDDKRVLEAAALLIDSPYPIVPILIGDEKVINEKMAAYSGKYESISNNELYDENLVDLFMQKRGEKTTEEEAKEIVKKTNYHGMLLVENGQADGLVGGCVYSTADILKSAFQVIGTHPDYKLVSSCFAMLKENEVLFMGDSAININPDSEALADIAVATSNTAKFLGLEDRRIAMLSFSTNGSGRGEEVDKVREATQIAKSKITDAAVEGEIQFDAAYVPEVSNLKIPNSAVEGKANIFIFPTLEAGNISYKMAQRLGGYEAIGPILQGLKKPVADLSRGASAHDIYLTSLIVYLQTN